MGVVQALTQGNALRTRGFRPRQEIRIQAPRGFIKPGVKRLGSFRLVIAFIIHQIAQPIRNACGASLGFTAVAAAEQAHRALCAASRLS